MIVSNFNKNNYDTGNATTFSFHAVRKKGKALHIHYYELLFSSHTVNFVIGGQQ
jgi:hypothetical protein